jgi:L-rhamnose mutarotase
MQRWWVHMADVMATNDKHEPISVDLVPMFWMK